MNPHAARVGSITSYCDATLRFNGFEHVLQGPPDMQVKSHHQAFGTDPRDYIYCVVLLLCCAAIPEGHFASLMKRKAT